MLIVDMGYIDGETISIMKLKRKVDILIPLRSDMNGHKDAIESAYYHDNTPWEDHPTRDHQQIKKVEHVDYLWDACRVPLIGCVVRELKEGKDGSGGREDYKHWVFVTTKLTLTGKRMIQTARR
jgi:hypothetical protein